jgi:hypothetical protein
VATKLGGSVGGVSSGGGSAIAGLFAYAAKTVATDKRFQKLDLFKLVSLAFAHLSRFYLSRIARFSHLLRARPE